MDLKETGKRCRLIHAAYDVVSLWASVKTITHSHSKRGRILRVAE